MTCPVGAVAMHARLTPRGPGFETKFLNVVTPVQLAEKRYETEAEEL